jgi:nucleoside-diphosphate-sugar epimerase
LRIGHVYGPGEEKYQKIIPVCFSKVLKNESIKLNGSGNTIRSFIYINDVISAILNSIKCKNGVGVINIVGGVPISIIDLITLICSISKIKPILEYLPVNLNERNIIFDNSKMLQFLDVVETPLNEGLIEEYKYMKNILN